MAIKNSPGYNTVLSCFISFLIIKRYKMTRMNIEISPIGMNRYVIIFDVFFCFSFVVYVACIMVTMDLAAWRSARLFK
jgi:hypothetical protein